MLVKVVDYEGLVQDGQYSPLSVWIETDDLKKEGSPSFQRLKQLLDFTPTPTILNTPGGARDGRVRWG